MQRAGWKSAKIVACIVLCAILSQTYALEPVAATYLEEALTAIERNFYRSSEVDWEAVRATATARAQGARVPEDTYAAIVETLIGLDAHSVLIGGPATRGAFAQTMGMGVQFDRLGENFFIASVNPGSGAEEVGLEVGDQILTGQRYDGPIDPDVLVGAGAAGEDAALNAALAWLRERDACAR